MYLDNVFLSVGIIASCNCFQFLRVYFVFMSCVSELETSVIAPNMSFLNLQHVLK